MRTSTLLSKASSAIKFLVDSHRDIRIRLLSSNELFASTQVHHAVPGPGPKSQVPDTDDLDCEPSESRRPWTKTLPRSATYAGQGSGWFHQLHLPRPLRQSKQRPSQRSFILSDRLITSRVVNAVECANGNKCLCSWRAVTTGSSRDDNAASCSCNGLALPPTGHIGQIPPDRIDSKRICKRWRSSDLYEMVANRSSKLVMQYTSSLRTVSC